MALPEDATVSCGLADGSAGFRSRACGTRQTRRGIHAMSFISAADHFDEPALKRARGDGSSICSCADELSLDFSFAEKGNNGCCKYNLKTTTLTLKEKSVSSKEDNSPLPSINKGSNSPVLTLDGGSKGDEKIVDVGLSEYADAIIPGKQSPAKLGNPMILEGTNAAMADVVCIASSADLCMAAEVLSTVGSTGVDDISKQIEPELQCLSADPPKVVVCGPILNTFSFAPPLSPPHGLISVCGRRREMEDAVTVVPSLLQFPHGLIGACNHSHSSKAEAYSDLHFFGVYDGHGGAQVAAYCKDHLHQVLIGEIRAIAEAENPDSKFINSWDLLWKKVLCASFLKLDQEIGGQISETILSETVGSTAVVALVSSCQIIVANCGDSRAVLSRSGQAIPLSMDHKPDREDEMARVEAAGGRVIFWNGHRVLGVLAMSRALGDWYLKPYVIAEPEVTCTPRSEDDEFLVLASDGLWDVLSNDVVCDITRKCFAGRRRGQQSNDRPSPSEHTRHVSPATNAAALLTKLALTKGSSDNISVVVVDLKTNFK